MNWIVRHIYCSQCSPNVYLTPQKYLDVMDEYALRWPGNLVVIQKKKEFKEFLEKIK